MLGEDTDECKIDVIETQTNDNTDWEFRRHATEIQLCRRNHSFALRNSCFFTSDGVCLSTVYDSAWLLTFSIETTDMKRKNMGFVLGGLQFASWLSHFQF